MGIFHESLLPLLSTIYGLMPWAIGSQACRMEDFRDQRIQVLLQLQSGLTHSDKEEGNFSTAMREHNSIQNLRVHSCPGMSSSYLAGISLSVSHVSGKALTATIFWQLRHSVDIALTTSLKNPRTVFTLATKARSPPFISSY